MAAQRYYYSDSITDFLSRSTNEIVGDLTLASQHDINDETAQSWVEEIDTLREALEAYSGRAVNQHPATHLFSNEKGYPSYNYRKQFIYSCSAKDKVIYCGRVFNWMDKFFLVNLINKNCEVSAIESALMDKSKTAYPNYQKFEDKNNLAQYQLAGYNSTLLQLGMPIERLLENFYTNVLNDEFGYAGLPIKLPKEEGWLEKCRIIYPELDNIDTSLYIMFFWHIDDFTLLLHEMHKYKYPSFKWYRQLVSCTTPHNEHLTDSHILYPRLFINKRCTSFMLFLGSEIPHFPCFAEIRSAKYSIVFSKVLEGFVCGCFMCFAFIVSLSFAAILIK